MNKDVFNGFPPLETERLILDKLSKKDVEGIYSFYSGEESLKFVAREFFTKKDDAIEKLKQFNNLFEDKKGVWWAFRIKETKELIGFGGFFEYEKEANKAELGYGFLPGNWGKGFGTEVVQILTDFGLKKLELHKIYAFVDPKNIASIKLLEKFGYVREALFKDHDFARGRYFDTAVYTKIEKNEIKPQQ